MMRFAAVSLRAALLLAALLPVACSLRPGAPEARAEFVIEKLITAPQDTAALAEVAVLPAAGPEALVEGVAARVGLAYFRARARLGARIRVDASDSQQQGDQQTVSVNAREGYTGGDVVRFRVHLVQDESGWRVTRITTD